MKKNNLIEVNKLLLKEEPFIYKTQIDGVLLIKRRKYDDDRGSFQELLRTPDIKNTKILQSQISISNTGVLRGIHIESRDKLITPVFGKMTAQIVDLRPKSKTFKASVRIDFDNRDPETPRATIFVPEGCGNSLCVTGKATDPLGGRLIYHYTYSRLYDPKQSGMGVRYDDPELAIDWPIKNPIISDRDKDLPSLKEFLKLYR